MFSLSHCICKIGTISVNVVNRGSMFLESNAEIWHLKCQVLKFCEKIYFIGNTLKMRIQCHYVCNYDNFTPVLFNIL